MKNRYYLCSLTIALLYLLSFMPGCGQKETEQEPAKQISAKVEVAPKEPNDSIDQANAIKPGQSFAISITPAGDRDWFKIDLPAQGYLKVQANNIPHGIEFLIRFALYNEWESKKENWLSEWLKLPGAIFVPEAGTYYFVLKDNHDDGFSDSEINIKADFIAEFDPMEPNNSPDSAKSIELGAVIKPVLFPMGDYDWIKIHAERQGYLSVMSNNVPQQLKLEVAYHLYDEWATPKSTKIRGWNKLPDACPIAANADYYLALHDDYDDAASEKPFDIKVDFIEEMDISEPNDEFKTAKTISREDTLRIALFPLGDYDYYKITIVDGDKLKFITKDVPSNLKPEISLYITAADDPDKLEKVHGWSKFPAEFSVQVGVTYFPIIHDDYNDGSSPDLFQILVK